MAKEPVTPYKMNLPTALKERIEAAAMENHRSMSGEIIHALEKAYPDLSTMDALLDQLDRMTERLKQAGHYEPSEDFPDPSKRPLPIEEQILLHKVLGLMAPTTPKAEEFLQRLKQRIGMSTREETSSEVD